MKIKVHRAPRSRQARPPTTWLLLNITLVLLMALASFGVATAAQ
jgi:hypothetical protein